MKKTIQRSFLIGLFINPLTLWADEIKGTIVEKENDRIKIELEGKLQPNIGDSLRIEALVLGRVADGGSAKITKTEGSFAWAKIVSGKPNVKMTAIITTENPIAANASAGELFDTALKLFSKNLNPKQDPYEWTTLGNSKSDHFLKPFPIFLKAARLGSSKAQYFAAKFLIRGPKEISDKKEGIDLLEKSASAGNRDAQYGLGLLYYLGSSGLAKNDNTAREYFLKAAEQGHAEAAAQFASLVMSKDYNLSKKYTRKAAYLGHKFSQLSVAQDYAQGGSRWNEPADVYQAIDWYKKAAAQGEVKAMVAIGDIYFYGGTFSPLDRQRIDNLKLQYKYSKEAEKFYAAKQIPVNINTAIRWYKKAAPIEDLYSGSASIRLGDYYSETQSKHYNPTKAFEYYNLGANKEFPHSGSVLGLAKCYQYGIGTAPSEERAFKLVSSLADKESPSAETLTQLGIYYRDGVGVPVDNSKALSLFHQASKAVFGSSWAKLSLADFYREGKAGKVDLRKAYEYYGEVTKSVPGRRNIKYVTEAYAKLARAWHYGEGVSPSPDLVKINAERALSYNARQPLALRIVGLHYQGQRSKSAQQQAMDYFLKAAAAGDAESHYQLGMHFSKGPRRTRDKKLAAEYFRKAAEAGHAEAAKKLGKYRKK